MPINEILAIYYTFENTCLIQASIEVKYPGDISQPLIISECQSLLDLSIFDIPKVTTKYVIKHDYNYFYHGYMCDYIDIWHNNEPSLKSTLGRCSIGSLDFSKNNESELNTLNDLLQSLQKSNRYIVNSDVKTTSGFFDNALLVAIHGLHDWLCGDPDINWMLY